MFIILCLLTIPFLKNYTGVVKANDDVTIWHVPGNFTKIQDAIYSPLVQDGDIILVHEGTYNENIVINRTLSLIGENKHTTIVDGGVRDNVVSIVGAINVVLEGFTIKNGGSYSGIFVDHSMNIEMSNNMVMNNQEGIRLYVSAGCIISDNNILNNNDGVSLYYSSDNTVSNNTIQSNTYYGINLDSSRKNLIVNNFIMYNGLSGVSMLFANDNVICGNTINSNYPYGINLYLSDNNTVYHNNFNNPTQIGGAGTNFWDYDGEGNYWSDYSGVDLFSGPYQNVSGSDGIGDAPYIISEFNRDNYPLMGSFSDFEVTLEEETYHVSIISNSTISDFGFEIGKETGNRIICFNVTGDEGSIGFSRVSIPAGLMQSYFVFVDSVEITPRLLNVSGTSRICLYFTYFHNNNTVSVISSKTLQLYYELLAQYQELLQRFNDLNQTYYELLNNYTQLYASLNELNTTYLELQKTLGNLTDMYNSLNQTYHELLNTSSELQETINDLTQAYSSLLGEHSDLQEQLANLNKTHTSLLLNYTTLQISLYNLNNAYANLWNTYTTLLGNYSALLDDFEAMNSSYGEHLARFSEETQNLRSLIYILAAITAIFIITIVYLSKHAHVRSRTEYGRF